MSMTKVEKKTSSPGVPQKTCLSDYRPPAFLIPEIELFFELDARCTIVKSRLHIRPNPKAEPPTEGLFLDAKDLELHFVSVDGKKLPKSGYERQERGLWILKVPTAPFLLEVQCSLFPEKNTALEGLYVSGGMLCTQNEAEGFRRITPFLDRPDVMSSYTVHLIADPAAYPVLLSNGNRISEEKLRDGRICVAWKDPYPKPCYLFALVAGNLEKITDEFVTQSARKVRLEVYVEPGNTSRAQFALESLKKAMQWDERNFGLEYDLDLYMIVAVEDFNMGAMENKGLNLFNAKLVLANPRTATDDLFESIEGVIAHEYFHNWTGNRVTCRDWFQLTLKEGLTVYRDQRFTEDRTSPAVKRIKDVIHLRRAQFAEDSGPLSHPIQPDCYIEINNFYTLTVYEKGAEVVRMIATLVGKEAFRRGIAEYFRLYDGQAVTIDEFLHAMGRVCDLDVPLFRRWYKQAGTPELLLEEDFCAEQGIYTLKITQQIPQKSKREDHKENTKKDGDSSEQETLTEEKCKFFPLLIPIRMGLLDEKGNSLALLKRDVQIQNGEAKTAFLSDTELRLDLASQFVEIRFEKIQKRPVLSFLRNFSAPVKYHLERSPKDLALLFARDPDPFARFDAGQSLMRRLMADLVDELAQSPDFTELLRKSGRDSQQSFQENQHKVLEAAMQAIESRFLCQAHFQSSFQGILEAFRGLLGETRDLLYNSLCLQLPALSEITENQNPPLFEESHVVLLALRAHIARELAPEWEAMFQYTKEELSQNGMGEEARSKELFNAGASFGKIYNKRNVALRRMKNLCLRYLCSHVDADRSLSDKEGSDGRGRERKQSNKKVSSKTETDVFLLCYDEFLQAENLTEELAAFQILCDTKNKYRAQAIRHFRQKWASESLVMDYYFSVQASAPLASTIDRVRELKQEDSFRMENPNKVRSLFGAFGRNLIAFHQADGRGYGLLAETIVELNGLNASMAAALARAFTKTRRLDENRQMLSRRALQGILGTSGLKPEVYEIVKSCLDSVRP